MERMYVPHGVEWRAVGAGLIAVIERVSENLSSPVGPMTYRQQAIAVSTLTFLAIFFHVLFCNWETGQTTGGPQQAERSARVIIPTGKDMGVCARSSATYTTDAILGIALPVTLLACGIFILAGPGRDGDLPGRGSRGGRPPASDAG